MEGNPCWFWSDSTVTLHWIKAPANTWQTFIGNRTSEIQQLTHGHKWKHVNGAENPADHVSRGMLPSDFLESTIWQHCPQWLSDTEENWPHASLSCPPPEEVLERRKTAALVQRVSSTGSLFERYSSFGRLVRVTAYILRFANNCRSRSNRQVEPFLRVPALKYATEALVKAVQREEFKEEIEKLARGKSSRSKPSIRSLSVFVDHKGILRVGGRLQQSEERYQDKHPMLIPKKHPFSRLIASHYHKLTLHSGPRMTLATMRQTFWAIGGKALTNYVCRKCCTCFRHNPVPVSQPVGQLPKTRTTPSRPFTITGVDYCGPVYMKPVHRRASPQKRLLRFSSASPPRQFTWNWFATFQPTLFSQPCVASLHVVDCPLKSIRKTVPTFKEPETLSLNGNVC